VARCLAPLHCLTKLELRIRPHKRVRNPTIASFSLVIAHNPNLTHFTFVSDPIGFFDPAHLFCDVPSDKPLKLEHVFVDDKCINFESLLPHIQHLSSYQFPSCDQKGWYTALSCAAIFPPTIKVWYLEPQVSTYLEHHPGIIALSVIRSCGTLELNNIMVKHAATLQYLTVTNHDLGHMFVMHHWWNLLKCTALRKLVLVMSYARQWTQKWGEVRTYRHPIEELLPAIARLDRSLTLVIKSNHFEWFESGIKYCRESRDPLIRDLTGRIEYERE